MHPKFASSLNSALSKYKKLLNREEKFNKLDEFASKFDIVHAVDINSYGNLSIDLKFDKRSEVDAFLVKLLNFYNLEDEDIPELELYGNSLSGYCNGITINGYPKSGSDCELIKTGEEYVSGYTRPIYKMKCEKEHTEAMETAGDTG